MRPLKLELINFLSHEHSVLDFTKLDPVTLVVGEIDGNPSDSNGAGKSTLLDGVLFALFGQCRKIGEKRGLNLNYVVRHGTSRADVIFDFAAHSDIYRITRTRVAHASGKGRSELLLQVQHRNKWQPIPGDRISETDKRITALIGADHETFTNTVLFPQGDIWSFAAMRADERKDVVRRILRLEQYDMYQETAKERTRQYDQQLAVHDEFLQKHSSAKDDLIAIEHDTKVKEGVVVAVQQRLEIAEQKTELLKNELATLKAQAERKLELEELIKGFKQDVTQAVEQLDTISEKEAQYTEQLIIAKEEFERFNEEIKRKVGQRPDRQAIAIAAENNKKKLEQWEGTTQERSGVVFALDGRIKSLHSDVMRIERLEKGKCPTCHVPVTTETKACALTELAQQKGEQEALLQHAQQQLQDAQQQLEQFKSEEQELIQRAEQFNTYIRELRLLQERASNARQRLQGLETMLQDTQVLVEQYEQSAIRAQDKVQQTQTQLNKLEDVDENHFRNLSAEIGERSQQAQVLRSQLQDDDLQLRLLYEQAKEKRTIIVEVDKKHQKNIDLERKRRIYRELVVAFGKKGIQAVILENCAVEIEEIANTLLHKLTGGLVQIEIQTQRVTTTGTTQEVFDILIKSADRVAPFDLYSGGEGVRIAFAVRIALSTLLARRAGTKISTLWYDEAFAQLDGTGRNQLIDAFRTLSQEFDYQLVISHRSDLRTEFESVIIVKKQGDCSIIIQ